MKNCPICNNQVDDNSAFCTSCGYQFGGAPAYQQPAPAFDPTDHTAEFDPKDISDNKVIAMLIYLTGPVGMIIALLMANSSPYVAFHLRQALKMTVCSVLVSLIGSVTSFLLLPAIAMCVALVIIFVLQIIAFFQVCANQAKEPAIIKNLKFLK